MNKLVNNLSRRSRKKKKDMTRQGDNIRREYDQIVYLDKCRFDILYAAHQEDIADNMDKLTENSFPEVFKRSEECLKQLTDIMRKLLILAKDDPKIVKIVIEIILEDERSDREEMERARADNFVIPGRPRHWRTMCWEGFKETIFNRITYIQYETRETSEDWLPLHLERILQAVISDLQHIQQYCVKLFPADWDIYSDSVNCYHECIKTHLEGICFSGLNKKEVMQLLAWINEYTGSVFLKHPALNIGDKELEAPLSYDTLCDLRARYSDEVSTSLREWLPRNLSQDKKDWASDNEPPQNDDYFYTQYPVLTFKILNENMGVAARITDYMKTRVLKTSLQELQSNLQEYTDAVKDYITKWSNPSRKNSDGSNKLAITRKSTEQLDLGRTRPAFFIQHVIALLNNFCLLEIHLNQLKERFPVSDTDVEKDLAKLIDLISTHSKECLSTYLSALTREMTLHGACILTGPWLNGGTCKKTKATGGADSPVEYICRLIKEYTSGLRLHYFKTFTLQIEEHVRGLYVKALVVDKRLVCKDETERHATAAMIYRDVQQLQQVFTSLSPPALDKEQELWKVVNELAEIIEVQKATVKLQLTFLTNNYPDVQEKHLSRILKIRGDFTNVLARKKLISATLKKPKNIDEKPLQETIFSTV